MEARGNPEHSMKSDICVQVKGDGVRRIITGVLSRPRGSSAGRGRHWLWRKVLSHSLDEGWSLSGFLCGLMLASLYGVIALILQNQPLWFCVHSTLVVALPTAFSMGLFAGVRADVMVMLPSMFSARGRHFLLFLFTLVLLTGPVQNTLENTERAAASLLCGAEQAANQTQELLRRASTPLLSALDKIREITSKAYAVVNRVHRLIYALTDGVRHVARILRNVLHFLVQIGDVCNEKLGSPYRKCRSVFNKGHADCVLQLGEFSPLCDVIKVFMPLCSLTRAAEFFCIIPSYIAEHLKEHLADPVVKAFQKMKREFEFNITATATFDLEVNSSLTLQQMTQDIMAEVSSDLHRFQDLSEPLKYVGLLLLLLSFIRAARYRRRYLSDLNFDNIYMTAQFEKLDQKLVSEGAVSVWPITRREATTYITPLSLSLSRKEKKTVLVGVASVVKYLVVGGVLVALDFLVFWILDQVRHQLTGDVVARAPVVVSVQVNGSGYASDIFRDLVSSFNVLQTGNITVISGKCLLRPLQPDYYSCLLLGFLMGLSLVISVTGGFVKRSRRLVCAAYYPQREEERIQFLRQQILDLRRAEGVALRRSAVRSLADRGEGGGEQSLPEKLLLWFPGGSRLSRLVGMTSTVTCVSCGEELRANQMDRVVCDVPQCPGLYCRPCFHSLGNTCVVCTRPLTFQEDSEEEIDSSDDEQLSLWTAALRSRRLADPQTRTLMEKRIAVATRRRTTGPEDPGDSELSEADMTYQDQNCSDESDSGESDRVSASPKTSRHQDQDQDQDQDQVLVSVVVHKPDQGP